MIRVILIQCIFIQPRERRSISLECARLRGRIVIGKIANVTGAAFIKTRAVIALAI